MLRVLFIDRSNPVFVQAARALAQAVRDLPVQIVFASDKEPSAVEGNLEIVNIHDVAQKRNIREIEVATGFSVHRALVVERAFFDYSSFQRCQRYSDYDLADIKRIITPYLNAYDYLIREKVDLVIEGLADNFMTSLAGRLARHYNKPFYMNTTYYWWPNGMIFLDRLNQTSSGVDRTYTDCYENPAKVNRAEIDRVYSKKTFDPPFGKYPLKLRLQQLLNRWHSYERISLLNWICRRVRAFISRIAIRYFIRVEEKAHDEQFVLFPLHVLPEAALLGTAPEIADQFGLIKNISMHLPFGVKLYVKDHPAQEMGFGLNFNFYRRLTSLPNVRYFKGSSNLAGLLAHPGCLAVAVINGTVGLEAAMKARKPVFVFGPAVYGVADCFYKPKNFEEFFANVQDIRAGRFRFNEDALYAILQALNDNFVCADIDMSKSKTWSERAIDSVSIYREFLQRFIQHRDQDSNAHGPAQ